jgi:hypothetical protein
MAMQKKQQAEQGTAIQLVPIEQETLHIQIKGKTPLIVHAWSAKAKQEMLDKQMGKKVVKQPKDPAADYESSLYRLSDGRYGFPTGSFKDATVNGARFFKGSVTMAALKPLLHFHADDPLANLMALTGEPIPREDMVRLAGSTADIRYRAEFRDWSVTLRVEFAPHMIDAGSVVALVDAGGRVGVGEWRPERGGIFGTYSVVGS